MPDGAPFASSPCVLGVSRSIAGRPWRFRAGTIDAARVGAAIARDHDMPELVARLLAGRGVGPDDAADFLAPTVRRALPDPSRLLDMDRAAERLAGAVARGETVGVFGDYDVDGACATALVRDVLGALGCRVHTHIPDRVAEGYGPNRPALARLAAAGATLIVCVDCGTAAGAVLGAMRGVADVLVLDHHRADGVPPGIVATVNPNRPDDRSGLGELCATGVAFLALVATLRLLRVAGRLRPGDAPDLMLRLDLVALATVCDVVPLGPVNRALVHAGLRVMARRARPGLAALLDVACGEGRRPDAATCGYALGPRINAGGRLGDPSLGFRLLVATDPDEARRIALALDAVNRERQSVEASILEHAIAEAEAQVGSGHATVVLEGRDWHQGVVGIVASRIRARVNRPACVGARADAATKGSGRSVTGLDLGAAVIAARAHGLLETGGGHAMAAGYGHRPGAAREFHHFLDERLADAAIRPAREDLLFDGLLAPAAATLALAQAVGRIAPFGNGNEEPLFAVPRARVVRAERLGREGRVVRAIVEGEGGGARLKTVLFGAGADGIAPVLLAQGAPPVHLAGHLRAERWDGADRVSFVIEDASPAI